MVDEHPYKVPEVDESKWFSGGHLGSQIQKVNWQASTSGFPTFKSFCPANLEISRHISDFCLGATGLGGAGGQLHNASQLLPPSAKADPPAVQEAPGPHGAQEPAARGQVTPVGV